MTLDDAITEYVTYRRTAYSANTAKSSDQTLRRFLSVVGNIQVRNIGSHHGEMYQAWMLGRGYAPTSVNQNLSMLRSFFDWARNRRIMAGNNNPLANVRAQKVAEKPRRRVPVQDFPRLLDAADHPQTRIILALGLYLFLRSSELVTLKLGDVDLDEGTMQVLRHKTKDRDEMPICAELDTELRRWLTWYTEDAGSLEPDWYLVPARHKGRFGEQHPDTPLNPTARMSNTSLKIHDALRGIGWQVTGEDKEGAHTLRRSGARALFDELSGQRGRDDALRIVMSMLGHKSVVTTERYLGLDVDREKRGTLLRGERMFTAADRDNVVELPTREVAR